MINNKLKYNKMQDLKSSKIGIFAAVLIVLSMFAFCGKAQIEDPIIPPKKEQPSEGGNKGRDKEFEFSVLQFNVWLQGTKVPNGLDRVAGEILRYKPDFVTFSEDSPDFLKRLCQALAQKDAIYYYNENGGSGLISKHTVLEYSAPKALRSMNKLVVNIEGQEIVVYSAHLDYTHYAEYLPRGYDGSGNKKITPVTDIQLILEEDAKSTRPQAIAEFIEGVAKEIDQKRIIILAGDFNEASHLDWTEGTKDLYDRNGVVVPWPTSTKLYANNFKDSYRVIHPNELTHPGFTWVVASPWIKDADERDRIDFIYYYDNGNIKPLSSSLIGPSKAFVGNTLVKDPGQDPILLPQSVWPSDHRALISKFKVTIPAK